jgi:hypothetical protein
MRVLYDTRSEGLTGRSERIIWVDLTSTVTPVLQLPVKSHRFTGSSSTIKTALLPNCRPRRFQMLVCDRYPPVYLL